ncbi:uncharacterized protein BEWA_051550 [Theileria equi strain WA]|uniref:Derlin n=1 Tax=Theileria equi strain WA TaxID=1537102 RepID=L1LD48_THEEQ|nr:uncharacterized protein BEWA_051550 [Theileria equi strain WA]EKX73103.1 membrane protein, putative [Theileria equi strain WA]|eukprot:XP_004832555.1 uncharacterized protein BEWA_051550 [Theileria equi strain WA]
MVNLLFLSCFVACIYARVSRVLKPYTGTTGLYYGAYRDDILANKVQPRFQHVQYKLARVNTSPCLATINSPNLSTLSERSDKTLSRVISNVSRKLTDISRITLKSAKEKIRSIVGKVHGFLASRDHFYISRLVQGLLRIPPVTAFYLTTSTLVAFASYFFNDNFPLDCVQYSKEGLLCGQAWRLFTPYFYFGQLWMAHFLMSQSVATYMSSVETAMCTCPEKFLEFLSFGMVTISLYAFLESELFKNSFLTTFDSLAYHLHTFILYFWGRLNEGNMVNCFDLFYVPAEYIPYLFMLQNFLLYREFSRGDIAAIVFSYIYYFYIWECKVLKPFDMLKGTRFEKLYDRFVMERNV